MSDTTTIVIETTLGTIEAELNAAAAPKTVANILQYVDEGFYDGTIFHRVIPGFMIQGGGMTADMREKANHAPVENEAANGLTNDRGTLAMARTNDPHSATSQFFINHKNNAFLNFQEPAGQGWGYCVFGKVTAGLDVVDAIAAVQTGNHGFHQDVPTDPVVMTKVARK